MRLYVDHMKHYQWSLGRHRAMLEDEQDAGPTTPLWTLCGSDKPECTCIISKHKNLGRVISRVVIVGNIPRAWFDRLSPHQLHSFESACRSCWQSLRRLKGSSMNGIEYPIILRIRDYLRVDVKVLKVVWYAEIRDADTMDWPYSRGLLWRECPSTFAH
jgi:hypothetical protein